MSGKPPIVLIGEPGHRRSSLARLFEQSGQAVVVADSVSTIPKEMVPPKAIALMADASSHSGTLSCLDSRFSKQTPILYIADREMHPLFQQQHQWRVIEQLTLPLRFPDIARAVHRLEKASRSSTESPAPIKESFTFETPAVPASALVGASDCMQSIRDTIAQVQNSNVTVLVLGESGTGKELIARQLHDGSERAASPFVALNCAAIPSELLESELFGHEKGAFTGAHERRAGRFEQAKGGTLFLDEIGDMPLPMQAKLLRVLEEKSFQRVGGSQSLRADVRIVAATHRDLGHAIRKGAFRQDLYYRLNVFPIVVPPLRERLEDVPLLLASFLSAENAKQKKSIALSSEAIQVLSTYQWPGNVRELANLIERLVVANNGPMVDLCDLPPLLQSMPPNHASSAPTARALDDGSIDLKKHLNELEQYYIKKALQDSGGVVSKAAERLKMGRTTLVEKMRKFEIRRSDISDTHTE